ncbi:MAG: putative mycofactocin-associated electron transfer flavoprotein [Streptosporangiales bacterium]|nr:putative mycofactocin-associated electron transfer flavoprotein [Streptosporangiales bacterium]
MRHLLHGVQRGRSHHLVVPGGRPGRRDAQVVVTEASPFVAAALKHVAVRARVDPLTGEESPETWGASDADLAALEWALRLGERWSMPVLAITVGPSPAETVLGTAAAAGASHLVRVEMAGDAPSRSVATALAAALAAYPGGPVVVCCGDASPDRGSGSVPAFLAHELGATGALGLVGIEPGERGVLAATRRLDRGRRERLRVTALAGAPAVLSVEAAGVRLRRAALPAVLAARDAPVEVIPGPASRSEPEARVRTVRRGPYRPRAKVLPAPAAADPRARIRALAGGRAERRTPQALALDPEQAADHLLAYLRETGYLS